MNPVATSPIAERPRAPTEGPVLADWLAAFSRTDTARVGGKNASLGELLRHADTLGIRVPDGFALTTEAFRSFLAYNHLDAVVGAALEQRAAGASGVDAGETIRRAFLSAALPPAVIDALYEFYEALGHRLETPAPAVAVRSSATAEDLPEASFAGQQETVLNVRGEEALLLAVRHCFASLYTDRAISYRELHGIPHAEVSLSVGVQQMLRADLGASGVAFTIDTETGFPRLILLTGTYGIGESIVQGRVNPDEWRIFTPLLDRAELVPILERRIGLKQVTMVLDASGHPVTVETPEALRQRACLTDAQVLQLARWCAAIAVHYGCPMDIEWVLDGTEHTLHIVQARPETVRSRDDRGVLRTYTLERTGPRLVSGVAVGNRIASGTACVLHDIHEAARFPDGAILVARQTDPDWVPVMRRASAIVTDAGGRTSHAAIVSRELGLAAVVGAGTATQCLDGRTVTVSCAEGPEGSVYEGALPFHATDVRVDALPSTKTALLLNIADPAIAMRWWALPVRGIGLARLEFVFEHLVGAHPMALLHPEQVPEAERTRLAALTQGYPSSADYVVDRLATGIALIAASRWPDPVVVRFSDFKTNEYAGLLGGAPFEPHEENPMLGFRGASRYADARYREGFALECQAIRRVREVIGLSNVVVMIPFCRTPEEADRVLAEMLRHGLARGVADLRVYMMAEIPSNLILAREFASRFDGFSIGSNDLTQLLLGVDRDNPLLASLFDERHPAVRQAIAQLIREAHAAGCPVGICGQAPSDYPEFAEFLVRSGIDSMSLNPDSVVPVLTRVAAVEEEMRRGAAPDSGAAPR